MMKSVGEVAALCPCSADTRVMWRAAHEADSPIEARPQPHANRARGTTSATSRCALRYATWICIVQEGASDPSSSHLVTPSLRAVRSSVLPTVAASVPPCVPAAAPFAPTPTVAAVAPAPAPAKARKTSNAATHNALDNKNFASSSHRHFHSCECQSHVRSLTLT